MTDGTFLEFESQGQKNSQGKWKQWFKYTETTIPELQGLPEGTELQEIFTVKPLTYSSCPFIQGIVDRQAQVNNQPGMRSQKTVTEWKINSNKPLSQEQLDNIRDWKIKLIDDFTTNLQGNQIAY